MSLEDLAMLTLILAFTGGVLMTLVATGLLCWWLIKDLTVRLWED